MPVSMNFYLTLFLACLVNHLLVAQNTPTKQIPIDTSFTTYQAWLKIKNDFPEATVVKPVLAVSVSEQKDIIYKIIPETEYGKRELCLDLFTPTKEGTYPAVIFIFGGGWRSGNKSMQWPLAMNVAAKGFATATLEYRLSPEATYPAAVYDIKDAIKYLRTHAHELNIDPDKITVSGCSAGGQLAVLVGVTSGITKFDGGQDNIPTYVQAIIDIDGILDFTDPNESGKDHDPNKPSAGKQWLGASYQEDPELWIEASPLTYIGEGTPPMLFINSALPRFHAGRDSAISILDKHGIYSEVHTILNTPHPFWLFHPWFEPTVELMINFLNKVLKE